MNRYIDRHIIEQVERITAWTHVCMYLYYLNGGTGLPSFDVHVDLVTNVIIED